MALKVWQEDATIPNKKQKESRFGIIKKYNWFSSYAYGRKFD